MASRTARGVFPIRAARLLLAVVLLSVSVAAAEESVKAGINDAFLELFDLDRDCGLAQVQLL